MLVALLLVAADAEVKVLADRAVVARLHALAAAVAVVHKLVLALGWNIILISMSIKNLIKASVITLLPMVKYFGKRTKFWSKKVNFGYRLPKVDHFGMRIKF